MKFWHFLTLAFAGLLLAGCADGGGATSTVGAAVNTVCPCMGGKIDGMTSTDWNGKTVGFCCPPCIETWNEMSDDERTAALAKAASGSVDAEHSEHGDHEHGDHSESGAAGVEAAAHDDGDHADGTPKEAPEAASAPQEAK